MDLTPGSIVSFEIDCGDGTRTVRGTVIAVDEDKVVLRRPRTVLPHHTPLRLIVADTLQVEAA